MGFYQKYFSDFNLGNNISVNNSEILNNLGNAAIVRCKSVTENANITPFTVTGVSGVCNVHNSLFPVGLKLQNVNKNSLAVVKFKVIPNLLNFIPSSSSNYSGYVRLTISRGVGTYIVFSENIGSWNFLTDSESKTIVLDDTFKDEFSILYGCWDFTTQSTDWLVKIETIATNGSINIMDTFSVVISIRVLDVI